MPNIFRKKHTFFASWRYSDIEYVDSWTQLGHILSSDCRDIKDTKDTKDKDLFNGLNIGVFKPLNKSVTYLVILEN